MPDHPSFEQALLPIEELSPNPWNTNHLSPENEAKLEASIKRLGMFKPIVVRALTDGTLQILGGQHRWEAAKRMGFDRVPVVNLGHITDKKAKEIGLVDNGRYGADDTIELSGLLKELGPVDELAAFLPYGELDLNNLFASAQTSLDAIADLTIDDDEGDDNFELPSAPPSHQLLRFKVPVEDIAWITALVESTMKSQRFNEEDSQTNAGNALVHLLNRCRAGNASNHGDNQ